MNMMVTRRALMGGMALGGAAALLPRAAWAWRAEGATLYPATSAFIEGFVERRELTGTLAAIGKGQDAPVFIGAGVQSHGSPTPVGPDTIWRLYSMTKPVTGIAAMLLVEDGKMRLDQPIADFLPAFANMKVQNTPTGRSPTCAPPKARSRCANC